MSKQQADVPEAEQSSKQQCACQLTPSESREDEVNSCGSYGLRGPAGYMFLRIPFQCQTAWKRRTSCLSHALWNCSPDRRNSGLFSLTLSSLNKVGRNLELKELRFSGIPASWDPLVLTSPGQNIPVKGPLELSNIDSSSTSEYLGWEVGNSCSLFDNRCMYCH